MLTLVDLNGDGYKDLRLSTVYDKESGDELTEVFIFNVNLKSMNIIIVMD